MDKSALTGPTIQVKVLYYNIVADMAGRREELWRLPGSADVGELISRIAEQYPAFRSFAQGPASGLRGPLRVFVNRRFVSSAEEGLDDGDEVRVFPVVSGG
jgi:MoaD family protein